MVNKYDIDSAVIEFIGNEEGLVLKPYLCSAKVPTIGYGCTYYEDGTKVKLTDKPITKERAVSMFKVLLSGFAKELTSMIKVQISRSKYNALLSLIFNIGVGAFRNSTLLKKLNAGASDAEIVLQFLRWNKVQGVENRGLTARRKREAKLFQSN